MPMTKSRPKDPRDTMRHDGLQVAKKTYCGTTVGYVVGWWVASRSRYFATTFVTFRSVRNGLIFPTEEEAKTFRDSIEEKRQTYVVEFQPV
jgi:hypothetical protein